MKNPNVTIITNSKFDLLSQFNYYTPFTDDQFKDALIYASNNSGKITISIDDTLNTEVESCESIYSKTGLRCNLASITMNYSKLETIMVDLIDIQNQIILGDLDMVVVNFAYTDFDVDQNNLDMISAVGQLLNRWKRQTEQITKCEVPMLIQVKCKLSNELPKIDFERVNRTLLHAL